MGLLPKLNEPCETPAKISLFVEVSFLSQQIVSSPLDMI